MKTTKIIADNLHSQDEKIGVMERCVIGAIHAMACDGAPMSTIMDMQEAIAGMTSTIWSICALKSCSGMNDKKADEFIAIQLKQFESFIEEIKEIFIYCDNIRLDKHLKLN